MVEIASRADTPPTFPEPPLPSLPLIFVSLQQVLKHISITSGTPSTTPSAAAPETASTACKLILHRTHHIACDVYAAMKYMSRAAEICESRAKWPKFCSTLDQYT